MPALFENIFIICCGLILGSFTTALSWRTPRGEDWVSARSRCPSCQTALTPADMVPVFSWLFAKGKCRHCGRPVHWRYPVIELSVLAAVLGVYLVYGFSINTLIIMAALPFFVALIAVDIERMILPNQLTLVAGVLGILFVAWQGWQEGGWGGLLLSHLGGAAVFAGLVCGMGKGLSLLLKRETLGFGDVKFFAVAGLWLGLGYLPVFLILSGVIGIVWGLFWRVLTKKKLFPFGPALVLSLYLGILLQGSGFSMI